MDYCNMDIERKLCKQDSAELMRDKASVSVRADIDLTAVVAELDERFVSIALDTGLIVKHWQGLDFSSVRLHTLVSSISPAYLRVGGNAADFLIFREKNVESYNGVKKQTNGDESESVPGLRARPFERKNISNFYMSGKDFDAVNKFARRCRLRLLFDLNVLLRHKDHSKTEVHSAPKRSTNQLHSNAIRHNNNELWTNGKLENQLSSNELWENEQLANKKSGNVDDWSAEKLGSSGEENPIIKSTLNVVGVKTGTYNNQLPGYVVNVVKQDWEEGYGSGSLDQKVEKNDEIYSEEGEWEERGKDVIIEEEEWDSSNAQLLLDYSIRKNYSENIDFELGNDCINENIHEPEPEVYFVRRFLDASTAEVRCQTVDAITVHHYYMDGRTATLEDFLSVHVLNSLQQELTNLWNTVKQVGCTRNATRMWLGETASCWGGGAPNLSNRYIAGFMWLDKLGLSATNGIHVVIRQSLYGGDYALLDHKSQPNTDYWVTLLFKRLVGRRVFQVKQKNQLDDNFRLYAHCSLTNSSGFLPGAVTVYGMNLGVSNFTLTLNDHLMGLSKLQYWMLPHGSQGLKSKRVSVSGRVLKLTSDTTFSEIHPTIIPEHGALILPPTSYGFIVFPDAGVKACL